MTTKCNSVSSAYIPIHWLVICMKVHDVVASQAAMHAVRKSLRIISYNFQLAIRSSREANTPSRIRRLFGEMNCIMLFLHYLYRRLNFMMRIILNRCAGGNRAGGAIREEMIMS